MSSTGRQGIAAGNVPRGCRTPTNGVSRNCSSISRMSPRSAPSRPRAGIGTRTASSTPFRIACRSTYPDWLSRSSPASLSDPRLELSGQKIVDHGQLPDLGVQLLVLFLINLGGFLTITFEHAGCAFQQCPLLGVDHRRMYPEPACQLIYRLLTLERLKCHLRIELRRMLLPLQHLCSPSRRSAADSKS